MPACRRSMNVLVAGGAGYIGSATVMALINEGHSVTVYDDLSTGHAAALPDDVDLVVADTADSGVLDDVFRLRPFDAVIDFAAFIEAGESMALPERYFRNNTANALNLVEAMLRHGVMKLVFSSSAAVYGDPGQLPITEDSRPDPTNAYGESKLQVERTLAWINRAHGFRYAALRYFNAAGAIDPDRGEDHRPESHLIPLVLSCALGKRASVPIYGADYPTADGTCVRDYVHVSDLAQAHVLALDALANQGRIAYNLGNGAGFSVREIVEAGRRVTGHKIRAVEKPRRSGDPAVLVANSESGRHDLGWKPEHPDLDDIVASAWAWHRRHPDGFGPAT